MSGNNSTFDFGYGTGGADPVPANFNPYAMQALPSTPAANGGWLSNLFAGAPGSDTGGGPAGASGPGVAAALSALAKGASAMGPQNQNIPQPAVPSGSPLGQPKGSLDAITQLLMNRANAYGPPGLLGAVR